MRNRIIPIFLNLLISILILGIFKIQGKLENEVIYPVLTAYILSTMNYMGAIVLLNYCIKQESKKFLVLVLGGMTLRMFLMLILIILTILFLKINQYYFIFTVFILYFLYLAAEIYITIKTDKRIYKY